MAIAALVVGCRASDAASTTIATDRPPNLVVTSGDESLDLEPTGFCWMGRPEGVCVDGEAPDPLPGFGSPVTEIGLEYPLDWPMTLYLNRPGGGACGLERIIQMRPNGDEFRLPVPVGRHVVDVEAVGDQGQGVWTFVVETNASGEPPPPHAEVRWYEDQDGSPPGVTMEVILSNLGEEPRQMVITVLVTDAAGVSTEFALDPNLEPSCWAGVVYALGGPATTGLEGGAAPYDIDIQYEMDGDAWQVQRVRWPDDAIAGLSMTDWLAATPAE